MPTWTENFTSELCAVIAAALPEISVILLTTEMNAIPWEVLVTEGINGSGPILPPFVVLSVGKLVDWPEYSPMEGGVYRAPVAVYHIHRKLTTPGQEDAILVDLTTLGAALRASSSDSFQCPGQPSYDVSHTNPANVVFANGNHPLISGELTADLLAFNIGSA